MISQTKPRLRCHFITVASDAKSVWIVDQDSGASVTNDAENVVAYLAHHYGSGKRFFYRDTMGRWDELAHSQGYFTGYKPGTVGFTPPMV